MTRQHASHLCGVQVTTTSMGRFMGKCSRAGFMQQCMWMNGAQGPCVATEGEMQVWGSGSILLMARLFSITHTCVATNIQTVRWSAASAAIFSCACQHFHLVVE